MRLRLAAVALSVALSAVTACSDPAPRVAVGTEGGSIEAEVFDSFAALVAASDRVVVGSVVSLERGPDEGDMATMRVTVRSERPGDDPTVVAIGLGRASQYDELAADLANVLSGRRTIWLLRSIDAFYPGVYRLVNQSALISPSPAGLPDFPLIGSVAEDVRTDRLSADQATVERGSPMVASIATRTFDDLASEAARVSNRTAPGD